MKEINEQYYVLSMEDCFENFNHANFSNYDEAKIVAKMLQNKFRTYVSNVPLKVNIKIFQTADEYINTHYQEQVKENALSKLTEEEKKVLGLA